MRTTKAIATTAAVFTAVCLAAPVSQAAETSKLDIAISALSGRILTGYELVRIFSGKTWRWKDGAAYFKPNRKFKAWVMEGMEKSYGEGSWSASNNGQLCIRATWHSLSGATKSFNCYVHRSDGAIYQRELPRGNWYLFAHKPSRAGDEIKKLERGDHVSAEYEKAKQYVERNSKDAGKAAPRRRAARPH